MVEHDLTPVSTVGEMVLEDMLRSKSDVPAEFMPFLNTIVNGSAQQLVHVGHLPEFLVGRLECLLGFQDLLRDLVNRHALPISMLSNGQGAHTNMCLVPLLGKLERSLLGI
jgi:hypothetical protein